MRTDGSGPQGLFTKSLATDSTQADFNLPHLWGRCPKSEHPAQDVQVWSKLALILHIKAPSLCDQTEGALAKGAPTVLCLSLQPLRGHPPTADAVPPPIACAMKVSHWIFARCAHCKSSSLTFPSKEGGLVGVP